MIAPQPQFHRMVARLQSVGRSLDTPLETDVFRFINPLFSKAADVVNGVGGRHASGRWNLAGSVLLSYTALSPETALAEALAHVHYYRLPVAQALPRVLVALRFQGRRVLDLRDGRKRQVLRISEATMRTLDWRAENQRGWEALTQAWGRAMATAGFEAVVVPSAADGYGTNVLVFPGNLQPASRLELKNEVNWPGK